MRQFESDISTPTVKSIPEEGEDDTTSRLPILPKRSFLVHRRKMSFPAVSIRGPPLKQQFASADLPAISRNSPVIGYDPLAKSSSTDLQVLSDNYQRRYRRFSNVSDAVSRKLSTTIGWRSVSVQDIVSQSKSFCGQYIRSRLKRSGVFTRRLGLRHLRSTNNLSSGANAALVDVFAQLQVICMELENLHPKIYSSICRQVAVTITNEKSVSTVLSSVARHLLKTDICWGKIASIYCVAGGLAVECVRQCHPEYVFSLVETMGLVIERDAAIWIGQQGGWPALLSRYRPPDDDTGAFQMIALSVLCLIVLLLFAIFVLRLIGKIAFGYGQTIPL